MELTAAIVTYLLLLATVLVFFAGAAEVNDVWDAGNRAPTKDLKRRRAA